MSRTFRTSKGTELPLLDLRGKDYLQVAHRLVWMREEHPDWSISTEIIGDGPDWTLFKATIRTKDGIVLATAHKKEDAKGFPDHIEKSETGAVGRALAMCGFGTQFCADELNEGERLADSPLARTFQNGLNGTKAINPRIAPEQPAPGDGHIPTGYRITFGKFNGKAPSEISPLDHRGYSKYLRDSAEKSGKPLSPVVVEYLLIADQIVIAWEKGNSTA